MAEIVQKHLESFLPELEQMERVRLLTHDEIKKLIKRRRAFEYALRRRTKTKWDYLKYIKYEVTLLNLIDKRRKRLRCNLKRKEIDHAIATRINKLFKAAIARNQNDISLWLTQVDFCQRMKWHHTISALFTQMLKVINNQPELWVYAAKWEFEENNAPENARQFLQQSLRFHPHSRRLWTEYFRMELMYIDWILKSQESEDSVNDAVLQGKIPLTVYKRATKAIPEADFAVSLIEIAKLFDFTQDLIDKIYKKIQKRHPLDEVALNAVARRPLLTLYEELKKAAQTGVKKAKVTSEVEEKVCVLYEEALEKVQSEKMWSYYIEFAISRWDKCKKEERKSKLLGKVLELMEQANSASLLSADLFVQWYKLLVAKGDEDSSCSVALEAARKWPKMVSMWELCLTAHMQPGKENFWAIRDEAMKNIREEESLPIWKLGMQWLSMSNPSKLDEYFEEGLYISKISPTIKEMYLEATTLRDGIEATRQLYQKLRNQFPLSPEFYKKMISIEISQVKSSITWLRKYFEDAIREYGTTNEDFWVAFIQLEREHPEGDDSKTDMYHWRAIKYLEPEKADNFVTKYTLLNLGQLKELFGEPWKPGYSSKD